MRARSILAVPADKPELFKKARDSEADALMFDLEDGCSDPVVGLLNLRNERNPDILTAWLRLPSDPLPGLTSNDIKPFLGVVLPKLRTIYDVNGWVERLREEWGQPRVLAIIETPQAVFEVDRIAQHPNVVGLIYGVADLRAELGRQHGVSTCEDFAQAQIVLAARAAGIPAYAGPATSNAEAYHQYSYFLGFDGAVVASPDEAIAANKVFRPPHDAVGWAERTLKTNGMSRVDGELVGPPHRRLAHAILEENERWSS